MRKYIILISFSICSSAHAALVGGRLNAFSEGQNAFAGVVNPANAVWLKDRFDLGTFWVHQRSSLINHNNNPLLLPGKTDLTYRAKNLTTFDAALHKRLEFQLGKNPFQISFSLATYTLPSYVKVRTKLAVPLSGNTPIYNINRTDAISGVVSFKLNSSHSIGLAVDYFYFSYLRNGYQNADNPIRSVSPGNVTNNGKDHSGGFGIGIGWRWKINEDLNFGAAWTRKSYCGQFSKYKGYEPYYATNYAPQTLGAGISYRFSSKIAGRLETLWMNLANIPRSNNNLLPDGRLNLNKRGSPESPGPGLQDALYINMGLGYQINEMLSFGAGYSHRFRPSRGSPIILSHYYMTQTIFNTLSLGANFNYCKHNLFLGITYGFQTRIKGKMPDSLGGGTVTGTKQNGSLSFSWGYEY